MVSSQDSSFPSKWTKIIQPHTGLFQIRWAELWRYRDLLMMLVRRDVVTVYKQTILGPVWYVAQPILTTLMFLLVFGRIARLSTDGLPPVLFYFSGIIIWNYFAECFNQTSITFKENQSLFGKVYFPRLLVPFSKVFSALIKFGIQFTCFLLIFTYYYFFTDKLSHGFAGYILLMPVFVVLMALFALGAGLIFTSLTTKYRDLTFLIVFGVQLLMYATPVIYPVSSVSEEYRGLIQSNPMTAIIEGFRYVLLGNGTFNISQLLYSAICTIVLLVIGIIIFNRTERTFMDTV